MSDQKKETPIEWIDGITPISKTFDDPYFNTDDGLAETKHVYLNGNDLPHRFCPGFHIGELGFGTGLNLVAAWNAWLSTGIEGPLQFTSFEAYPMRTKDMRLALSKWPEYDPLADVVCSQLEQGNYQIITPTLNANIIIGDARHTLAQWDKKADAWFLDGFSPDKNPELWGKSLMAEVTSHTNQGGSFATYTAAGHIRKHLASAGFNVTRVSGYGRKRHMTIGTM